MNKLEELCTGDDSITGARQTLLLLHDHKITSPMGTPRWLDRRPVDRARTVAARGVERQIGLALEQIPATR